MGRKRNGQAAAEWRGRLRKFRRSGLTVAEFCRRESVSQPSFYQWRRRLTEDGQTTPERRGDSDRTGATVAFAPLRVSAAAVAEVELPNGVRIRVPADSIEALRAAVLAGSELCREGA